MLGSQSGGKVGHGLGDLQLLGADRLAAAAAQTGTGPLVLGQRGQGHGGDEAAAGEGMLVVQRQQAGDIQPLGTVADAVVAAGASPDITLYEKLGLDPRVEYSKSAIGVLTISPAETAIIAGDIAIKAAGIELGFVDRFSGTLIVTGTISETEAAIRAVLEYVKDKMGFSVCEITRT